MPTGRLHPIQFRLSGPLMSLDFTHLSTVSTSLAKLDSVVQISEANEIHHELVYLQ